MPAKEVLKEAQKLYDEGKWLESNSVLDDWFSGITIATDEEVVEAYRLMGWNYYYIATKGLGDKKTNLENAEKYFRGAWKYVPDKQASISILNGLPLVLWLLNEKAAAWSRSEHDLYNFPDEPSIWNTRAILCRWAKNFEESVKVCEKVYETALRKRDYRTAGHGKQNRGDALKELGRIAEARDDYVAAVGLYKDFEKTGESAKFHIDGVAKKLSAL